MILFFMTISIIATVYMIRMYLRRIKPNKDNLIQKNTQNSNDMPSKTTPFTLPIPDIDYNIIMKSETYEKSRQITRGEN